MTFIQPNKDSSFLNKILILLIPTFILGAFWLVILYNNIVNFDHGLAAMKSEFQQVQEQNADLKNKIFNLFDASDAANYASSKLVKDKNPKYLEVNAKWSYASQY